GAPSAGAAKPWPFNTGIPLDANCSAPVLQQRRVYVPQQVQTASPRYRATASPARSPMPTPTFAENREAARYNGVIDAVLAMTTLAGVSSFVAAGDSGSTTCGTSVVGTTLSYPAVSPFVTAVGGTRLTLGTGNTRVAEIVWNDSAYGAKAAGGGGLARRESRPAYQD